MSAFGQNGHRVVLPVHLPVLLPGVAFFGVAALALLKTDEFPDVQPPIVVVSILYPGAAPENVEREVLEPIEDVVSGISGVYDVQYSQDAGASWADLLAGTTATQITFETEPGVTVLFRVRATDRVGNEGYSPLQGPYRGALQITNRTPYQGYEVYTQMGLRVSRIDIEVREDSQTETFFFFTVYAGFGGQG